MIFLWIALISFPIATSSLIPRETLISSAENIWTTYLSPDGKFIGFIAHDDNNIRNVFSMRSSDLYKRQLTFEKRNLLSFAWTGVEDLILFEQDNHGDENSMIFKLNISEQVITYEPTIVFNVIGVKAMILGDTTSKDYVLIALNNDIPSYHNVYQFDLFTNELTLVFLNNRFSISNIFVDNDLNIRLVKEDQEDGSTVFFRLSGNANTGVLNSDAEHWKEYLKVEQDDIQLSKFVKFDKSNENVYFLMSEGTDLGCMVIASYNNFTERRVIYLAEKAELQLDLYHPVDHTILALTEDYIKPEFAFVNDTVADDLTYLADFRPTGSFDILSVSNDMSLWLVTYRSSEKPREIFIYRRYLKSIELLFKTNRELENYKLNEQIGFDFVARDGLRNTPLKSLDDVSDEDKDLAEKGLIPEEPQKLVLRVHGGPHGRDIYHFDNGNAFLTSRGYAVMQVNFRGSSGFGKALLNSGIGEWSRKMQYDLLDAVEFAIAKGIVKRSEIAIMGGSYGGYATLVGLTFTPDIFACGVDFYGVSNLVSFLESVPPYWRGHRQALIKRMGGNLDSEEGRKELIDRSPLFFVDQVKKPLLIMHRANDPRIKLIESEQFVFALQNQSIPVTYAVFPDEGHGFRRIPNQLAQFGLLEKFLHDCLGGAYLPFTEGQYNESAIIPHHRLNISGYDTRNRIELIAFDE